MNYKQKYEELLENLQTIIDKTSENYIFKSVIENILPKKESEDEKIKKMIKEVIQEDENFSFEEKKLMFSWIENYSESKLEKELAESYLAVFNKKYPILPNLKGEQRADFKNFLNKCQQEFGLKEFGIHPTQSKLFEKLTLLWAIWGAEHLSKK